MCHFLPILVERRRERDRLRRRVIVDAEAVRGCTCCVVSVVSRQTLIMLTILASCQTGMQARQILDRKPPTWASILSSCTIFSVFCRATAGELSSSAMSSSTGRPLMPPLLLMRSAAICKPTTAVLPPAAPAPGQRLLGADLVGLGGAEGGAPRRRHQHHGADRAAAPADDAAARDLAAVPDVLGPLLFFPFLSHRMSLLTGFRAWPRALALDRASWQAI